MLLFKTLVPKFTKNERKIITVDAKKINFIELKFIEIISRKSKEFGNVNDQKSIWNKGNKKLIKKILKQNKNARILFLPFKLIFSFFLFNEPVELWNFIFFLKKLSSTKRVNIKKSNKNDRTFAVFKSSKMNHEL